MGNGGLFATEHHDADSTNTYLFNLKIAVSASAMVLRLLSTRSGDEK